MQVKKDVGVVNMIFYCCGIPSPRSLLTQPPQSLHVTIDLTLTSFYWVIIFLKLILCSFSKFVFSTNKSY